VVIPLSVESAIHYHDAIGVDNLPASRLFSKVGRLKSGAPPPAWLLNWAWLLIGPRPGAKGRPGFNRF